MQYTIENNILHKSQLGFVPGNRTSDANIIINNLIRKYCHKRNSKIFSCFVDFAKAFDTIPRDTIPRDTIPRDTIPRDTIPLDILLKKLLSHNIKVKFFNIVRSIYIIDKACVKIRNQSTELFEINKEGKDVC